MASSSMFRSLPKVIFSSIAMSWANFSSSRKMINLSFGPSL